MASTFLKTKPADIKYDTVPLEEKERLFSLVKNDIRYNDYLYGCYECGICVAACPSARFYDFSPRRIAQAAAREDAELMYQYMNEDVWDCSQCFSCLRCPRGNNPGGLITIMREVAVNNGMKTAKDALEGYGRVIYKIMSTGTQVSPDMLQPDFFPDWGPWVQNFSQNMHVWRKAIPMDSIRGLTDIAWRTDRKTLLELYTIWFESGNMEIIKELDESLYDLLTEVMQEELEEG